jgi:hypothetical protein
MKSLACHLRHRIAQLGSAWNGTAKLFTLAKYVVWPIT